MFGGCWRVWVPSVLLRRLLCGGVRRFHSISATETAPVGPATPVAPSSLALRPCCHPLRCHPLRCHRHCAAVLARTAAAESRAPQEACAPARQSLRLRLAAAAAAALGAAAVCYCHQRMSQLWADSFDRRLPAARLLLGRPPPHQGTGLHQGDTECSLPSQTLH